MQLYFLDRGRSWASFSHIGPRVTACVPMGAKIELDANFGIRPFTLVDSRLRRHTETFETTPKDSTSSLSYPEKKTTNPTLDAKSILHGIYAYKPSITPSPCPRHQNLLPFANTNPTNHASHHLPPLPSLRIRRLNSESTLSPS